VMTSLSRLVFFSHSAATRNSYDEILTGLKRPGGGDELGKYYSLPALSDPRIGELVWMFFRYAPVLNFGVT